MKGSRSIWCFMTLKEVSDARFLNDTESIRCSSHANSDLCDLCALPDLPVLRDLGIDTSKWVHGIHLQTPHSYAGADVGGGPSRSSRPPKTARDAGQPGQVYIVDTQKLFAVLEGRTSVKVGTSLKRMCALLQVNGGKIERLHNAGTLPSSPWFFLAHSSDIE